MLANLVCSLIKHKRITTTLAKAKAARSVAEKLVTLGKSGTISDRRLAAARLHHEDVVKILFNEIAPAHKERRGGYTRIVKLGQRIGDSAQSAILEWVDAQNIVPAEPTKEKKSPKPETEAKDAATENKSAATEASSVAKA